MHEALSSWGSAVGYDRGTSGYIRNPADCRQFAELIRQLGLYWLVINQPPPKL